METLLAETNGIKMHFHIVNTFLLEIFTACTRKDIKEHLSPYPSPELFWLNEYTSINYPIRDEQTQN